MNKQEFVEYVMGVARRVENGPSIGQRIRVCDGLTAEYVGLGGVCLSPAVGGSLGIYIEHGSMQGEYQEILMGDGEFYGDRDNLPCDLITIDLFEKFLGHIYDNPNIINYLALKWVVDGTCSPSEFFSENAFSVMDGVAYYHYNLRITENGESADIRLRFCNDRVINIRTSTVQYEPSYVAEITGDDYAIGNLYFHHPVKLALYLSGAVSEEVFEE